MANMSLVKNPMPEQDPNVRNKNFKEVALGYTKEQAIDEATRCLNCKAMPCIKGCPVQIHSEGSGGRVRGSIQDHYEEQFSSCCLWSCVPAGESV